MSAVTTRVVKKKRNMVNSRTLEPSGQREAHEDIHPRIPDYLVAAPLAAASTVNLWKLESIRQIVPLDLTVATMAPVAIFVLAVLASSPKRLRAVTPLLIFLGSLLPGLALSSFAHPYSMQKSIQLFTFIPLLMAGGMLLLGNARRQRAFINTIVVLGVAIAIGIEVGGTVAAEGSERVGLEDGNTIALARMCALAVVCLLVSSPLKRPTLPALGAAALCLHASFMTGSRGPLVAALMGITIAVVFAAPVGSHQNTNKWERRLITRVLPLAAMLTLAWQFVQNSRLVTAFGGASDEVRVQLLLESLRLTAQAPWGLGWGDFVLHMNIGLRNDLQGWAQYPHNILAESLMEGGVIAFVVLTVISWYALQGLWTLARESHPTMLALFITIYGSALTSSDLTSNRVLWTLIGLGLVWRARAH
ncbi:O-antigen ligase family protein [Luteococcus sp. OSA5]|uniref:O-antigen ligase family protein n=1 Tax=Luteococcus sp. OSA5 TaxID=3401630 RepID=UPI003B43CC1B